MADLDRGDARRISLAGFDDAELSDLVMSVVDASSGPGGDVVRQLREETAGNPLYAAQLVRHLVESGHIIDDHGLHLAGGFTGTPIPPSLLDVVWSRVRALGEVTYDVLRAGSVLGVEFDDETVVEMTDASDAQVAASLDSAVEAGLLFETYGAQRAMRFTHALVAHALYSELGGSRRRRLHERAARVLLKSSDAPSQGTVVELARHSALAGDLAGAQRWATDAGDHALAHLAPNEAARWFRTALGHALALERPESERADLTVRLGEAQHRAGDPRGRDTLLEAAGMARRAGAPHVLIRAALANDRGFTPVGAVDEEQLATLEAAIAVVDRADTAAYANLLAHYAQELVHKAEPEVHQRVARQAIELIETSDDPALLPRTISGLMFALWGPGTLALRRRLAAKAVVDAQRTDDVFLQFWTSRAAYYVAIESADPAMARASLERIRSIASEVGEPRLRWFAAVFEAFDAMMEARLDDAERHSELVLEIGTQIGEPDAFSFYSGQLFVNRSFAGRYEEILPLVQAAVDANPDVLAFRLALGITCTAVDRNDEARAILDRGAADGFSRIPVDLFRMTTVIGYAVLAIELGDAEIAAQLSPLLEPFAGQVAFNGATSQGPISAYLGKLASLMGLHDVADAHLRGSLEVALAFGWKYHQATTLVALALSRLRRAGALDDEAQAWLDQAGAIAADRGLLLVALQVESVRG